MTIPRVTTVDVYLKPGEELRITPLSDLHIESANFELGAFDRLMKEREGHRVLLLGDVMDLVVPTDLKRWRSSVQDSSIAGRDDWFNAALDLAVERLAKSGAQYDLVIPGNHEDEYIKRHGTDVTSMIARELRCSRGGYSGIICYVLRPTSASGEPFKHSVKLPILYHHGAWGGRVMKGFGGARDWARAFDNWAIFCYGHNHQATVHREVGFRVTPKGRLEEFPRYFVCTGSWVENFSDDGKNTHYAERAGHMPTPRCAPLIRAKLINGGGNGGGWRLEYTVEI